jgi:hypothetical protein
MGFQHFQPVDSRSEHRAQLDSTIASAKEYGEVSLARLLNAASPRIVACGDSMGWKPLEAHATSRVRGAAYLFGTASH